MLKIVYQVNIKMLIASVTIMLSLLSNWQVRSIPHVMYNSAFMSKPYAFPLKPCNAFSFPGFYSFLSVCQNNPIY